MGMVIAEASGAGGVDAPARRVLFFSKSYRQVLLLTLLAAAGSLSAQVPGERHAIMRLSPTVNPRLHYAIPPRPIDLDQDGDADLAVLTNNGVTVYLNDGSETVFEINFPFRAAISIPGSLLGFLLPGDLDGDGLVDLVVSDTRQPYLLRGWGDGTFADFLALPLNDRSGTISSLALGDVTQDGLTDIVVARRSPEPSESRLTIVPGGFDLPGEVYDVPSDPRSLRRVVLGDFNGDTILDLAAHGIRRVTVHHGLSGGQLSDGVRSHALPLPPPPQGAHLASEAEDFDRDGEDEIVVVEQSFDRTVVLLVDRIAGHYEIRLLTEFENRPSDLEFRGDQPMPLVVTDLDADGWQDLVLMGSRFREVMFLRSLARAEAEVAEICVLGLDERATGLTIADLDADGAPDLAALKVFQSELEIVFSLGDACAGRACRFGTVAALDLEPMDLVATEDINGDAADELLLVTPGAVDSFAWREDGLTRLAGYTAPEGADDIALGDLDGDGWIDFAITDPGERSVQVSFLGEGQVLLDRLTLFAGGEPSAIEIADVSADGRMDLVTCLRDQGQIAVFLGEGRGRFSDARVSEIGRPQPRDLTIGDFDGDGSQDVMVLSRRASSLRFLPGTDDGFFGLFLPAVDLRLREPGYVPGPRIESADLDGDGLDDLVVAGRLPSGESRLTVFRGDETTRFDAQWIRLEDGDGADFLIADVLPRLGAEFLTVDPTRARVTMVGSRTPFVRRSFPLALPFGANDRPRLAVGKFNGDGRQSIVIANATTGQVEVLEDVACRGEILAVPEFRRGDANQDGTVGLTDAVTVLQHLFAAGEALACEDAADTDDNGALNLADPVRILAFLFNSGASPAPPGPLECGEDPTEDELRECEGECL